MHRRAIWLTLALTAVLGACTTQVTGPDLTVKPTTSTAKPKADASAAPKVDARALEFQVNAPAGLVAAGAGNIVNADPNGLVSARGLSLVAAGGGNLVAAGGGNLVAAGGGNLVAAGGGNLVAAPTFTLQAKAIDGYLHVEKAVVYFATLPDAQLADKTAMLTDADGKVKFPQVADGTTLIAVAEFKVGDKSVRLGSVVPTGKPPATMIDPINTIVEGRIRKIMKDNNCPFPNEAGAELKRVWELFNDAGADIDVKPLLSGTTLEDIDTWYQTNLAKLDAAGQQVVKDYMAKIKSCKK